MFCIIIFVCFYLYVYRYWRTFFRPYPGRFFSAYAVDKRKKRLGGQECWSCIGCNWWKKNTTFPQVTPPLFITFYSFLYFIIYFIKYSILYSFIHYAFILFILLYLNLFEYYSIANYKFYYVTLTIVISCLLT